jgi:hypothetical protein
MTMPNDDYVTYEFHRDGPRRLYIHAVSPANWFVGREVKMGDETFTVKEILQPAEDGRVTVYAEGRDG